MIDYPKKYQYELRGKRSVRRPYKTGIPSKRRNAYTTQYLKIMYLHSVMYCDHYLNSMLSLSQCIKETFNTVYKENSKCTPYTIIRKQNFYYLK